MIQLVNQRFVHFGPLVLEADSFKFLTPTADRDRTVSRRSEPSSRTALIGEQPNPWELLVREDRSGQTSGLPVVSSDASLGSYVWKG